MIALESVSKWYGQFKVLDACSTQVEKGEVVVICGPSGSGKTMTLRLLAGLDQAETSVLRLGDRDRLQLLLDLNNRVVSNLDLRELFRAISSGIRRVMECDYAGLSLPDPEKEQTMRVYALDFPEGKGLLHEEMQVPFEGASSAAAFLTMKPVILDSNSPGWRKSPIAQIAANEGLKELCF